MESSWDLPEPSLWITSQVIGAADLRVGRLVVWAGGATVVAAPAATSAHVRGATSAASAASAAVATSTAVIVVPSVSLSLIMSATLTSLNVFCRCNFLGELAQVLHGFNVHLLHHGVVGLVDFDFILVGAKLEEGVGAFGASCFEDALTL